MTHQEAIEAIEQLVNLCATGAFYADYDKSSAALNEATRALERIRIYPSTGAHS